MTPLLRIQCHPTGPLGARLMIVGEAPGEKEVEKGVPFVGASGWLLDECLREAGLFRGQAFVTNVARERPPENDVGVWIAETIKARTPDHTLVEGKWVLPPLRMGRDLLLEEVRGCAPRVIVALGNVALWALTGEWGIRKWRSSLLPGPHGTKVIPALHPAAVLREWPLRRLLVHDLGRVAKELEKGPGITAPVNRFITRPDYATATATLSAILARLDAAEAPVPIAADIETRGGHTACIGFATSSTEAICIPWMCVERPEGYWTLEEEVSLIILTRRILLHPRASLTWQNGAYDHQYEHRWHFIHPGLGWDTMLAHHAMFSISPKSLDHLSSLYCAHHVYWKDDGKLWDPATMPEDQHWAYNCEDCVRTFEIREAEEAAIATFAADGWPELPSVVAFQHRLQPAIVRMMFRGVRSDDVTRAVMSSNLLQAVAKLESEITSYLGHPLNIGSPKQMADLFYTELNQSPIYKRQPNGHRTLTTDDEALLTIAAREPVLRPVIRRMQALRSARVFKGTFLDMRRDIDGRLRCSYNVAGTKTYRLASSENAFGSGGNLQNVSLGDEDALDSLLLLPNIRRLFLFDPGMTGFDLDGDSADLRIVTGESGCRAMQAYFAAGAKPYVEIAREFYRDPTITKHHPSYKRMKALCHGSNYGGEPPGLSERIGLPVHDIERMQNWYFGMCPEIKTWQTDTVAQFNSRGYIQNPFGYRLWRWDRPSRKLANEALAWTPQSTVGIFINHCLVNIDEQLPWVELLLQTHDSLNGQFPSHMGDEAKRQIVAASQIPIPCQTGTIVIPVGLKTSNTSWGDCE